MKSNKETPIRGYHRTSHAHYSQFVTETDVIFGLYYPSGGCQGEMAMVWENLNGECVARLKCFYDGFEVLSTFTDVLEKLGSLKGQNIEEVDFLNLLEDCGFKDLTKY